MVKNLGFIIGEWCWSRRHIHYPCSLPNRSYLIWSKGKPPKIFFFLMAVSLKGLFTYKLKFNSRFRWVQEYLIYRFHVKFRPIKGVILYFNFYFPPKSVSFFLVFFSTIIPIYKNLKKFKWPKWSRSLILCVLLLWFVTEYGRPLVARSKNTTKREIQILLNKVR